MNLFVTNELFDGIHENVLGHKAQSYVEEKTWYIMSPEEHVKYKNVYILVYHLETSTHYLNLFLPTIGRELIRISAKEWSHCLKLPIQF